MMSMRRVLNEHHQHHYKNLLQLLTICNVENVDVSFVSYDNHVFMNFNHSFKASGGVSIVSIQAQAQEFTKLYMI